MPINEDQYWSMLLNKDKCRSMPINANQCWIRGCYIISFKIYPDQAASDPALIGIDRHLSVLRSIDLYWFSLIDIDIYWSVLMLMPQIWSGIDRYWPALIINTACPVKCSLWKGNPEKHVFRKMPNTDFGVFHTHNFCCRAYTQLCIFLTKH